MSSGRLLAPPGAAARSAAAAPRRRRRAPGQPAQAYSLGVGTNSPASNARDRCRQLGLESGHVIRAKTVATTASGTLEEVVDDLDLRRAGAETRERVDEPLQPVLVVDDLLRRALGERVRLVVDDERARPSRVEHVEEAADENVVVLEGELALRSRTSSSAATRRASGDAQYDATKPPISCSSSSLTRGCHARTRSTSTSCGSRRSIVSSSRCTASPTSSAPSPSPSVATGRSARMPTSRSA